MRFSGWLRLAILICGLYLLGVVVRTALEFPHPEQIHHTADFYKRMRPESLKKMRPTSFEWADAPEKTVGMKDLVDEFVHSDKKWEELLYSKRVVNAKRELPNGHIIYVSSKFSKDEVEEVVREYWGIVEKKCREKRTALILEGFLLWAGPSLAIVGILWGVGRVSRGPKKPPARTAKPRA